jgi:hypothetical protein
MPSEKKMVIMVGQPGDILPWSQKEKLLLLTPAAVSGVLVPKGYTGKMMYSHLGLNEEELKSIRYQLHPVMEEVQAALEVAVQMAMHRSADQEHGSVDQEREELMGEWIDQEVLSIGESDVEIVDIEDDDCL